MIEKPAKDVEGFLLYNPFAHRHFFRIYNKKDKRKFTDYDVRIEDLEIKIICNSASLYKTKKGNFLDWNSKVLGRDNG